MTESDDCIRCRRWDTTASRLFAETSGKWLPQRGGLPGGKFLKSRLHAVCESDLVKSTTWSATPINSGRCSMTIRECPSLSKSSNQFTSP